MDKKNAPVAATAEVAEKKAPTGPRLIWDDSKMRSQYVNMANVTGGREEIVMVLGMNQAWQPGQKEVRIEVSDRIVMSPFAAKRLAILLTGAVKAYEQTYGKIELEGAATAAAKAN